MNPFIFFLVLLLALWLIINLPFILLIAFNSFMAIFSFDEKTDDMDLFDFNLSKGMRDLFFPTVVLAQLFGWLIILFRICFKFILGILTLYFGWQLIQQMILLGNLWKWDGWSWTGFVIAGFFTFVWISGAYEALVKVEPVEKVEAEKAEDIVFEAFK